MQRMPKESYGVRTDLVQKKIPELKSRYELAEETNMNNKCYTISINKNNIKIMGIPENAKKKKR